MTTPRNPMQPFVMDGKIVRFKRNAIVDHVLDAARKGGVDLNSIACGAFSQDDREQFAQLIGYSLSGFHELSYVSDETALQATQNARIQMKTTVGACRDDGCEIHCGVALEISQ